MLESIHILRYDGWRNGHLGADMLTWRGINSALNGKGTCDLMVGQLDLKELLFDKHATILDPISS